MKKIEAIIREERLEAVKKALAAFDEDTPKDGPINIPILDEPVIYATADMDVKDGDDDAEIPDITDEIELIEEIVDEEEETVFPLVREPSSLEKANMLVQEAMRQETYNPELFDRASELIQGLKDSNEKEYISLITHIHLSSAEKKWQILERRISSEKKWARCQSLRKKSPRSR